MNLVTIWVIVQGSATEKKGHFMMKIIGSDVSFLLISHMLIGITITINLSLDLWIPMLHMS